MIGIMRAEPGWRMRAEMYEQPEVVARVLEGELSAMARLARDLRARKPHFAAIAGRGTSDHAAVLAKYCLEWGTGIPVALAASSIRTVYHRRLRLGGALVLGISQSGRSPDVVEYLRSAGKMGALTVAITNESSSPLARAARHVLLCHAGTERSVAATKTFLGEAACICLLLTAWTGGSRGRFLLDELRRSPEHLSAALELDGAIEGVVVRAAEMDRCLVLGRGFSYSIALETALKLQEAAGVFAAGMSSADFLHGPLSMACRQARRSGFRIVLLAPGGSGLPYIRKVAARLRSRKVPLLALSSERGLAGPGREAVFGKVVPEWLSPLPWAVLGQLAAYHAARSRGLDPDRPEGLRKITLTR